MLLHTGKQRVMPVLVTVFEGVQVVHSLFVGRELKLPFDYF